MIRAYTQTLKNYMAFSGRTKRSDFWLFVLAQTIIFVIGLILVDLHDAASVVLVLYLLGTLIPTLAATVRRLRDAGRGFWWLPLGVSLTPVGCVLGTLGFYVFAVGLGLAIIDVAFGGFFALGEAVTAPFGDCVSAPFEFGSDLIGLFTGRAEEILLLGLGLLAIGVVAGIVGGVLSITLLVFLVSPSTFGENKYGPQPE